MTHKTSALHAFKQVVGDSSYGIRTCSVKNINSQPAPMSQIEPKIINKALLESNSVVAMEEKLAQFKSSIWELVARPEDCLIIDSCWVSRNKMDANGSIDQTKARLMAQSFNQVEALDYDKTYASVARLQSI